jgi:hypothetical protein
VVIISKKAAAAQQIETAILLYHKGNVVCATTLCGAAEGCIPQPNGSYLFEERKAFFKSVSGGRISEREAVAVMNEERDWLKHYNTKQPEEMEIDDPTAFNWIGRALTKYVAAYGDADLTGQMKVYWASLSRSEEVIARTLEWFTRDPDEGIQ